MSIITDSSIKQLSNFYKQARESSSYDSGYQLAMRGLAEAITQL